MRTSPTDPNLQQTSAKRNGADSAVNPNVIMKQTPTQQAGSVNPNLIMKQNPPQPQ
jgi:hypothetical protein